MPPSACSGAWLSGHNDRFRNVLVRVDERICSGVGRLRPRRRGHSNKDDAEHVQAEDALASCGEGASPSPFENRGSLTASNVGTRLIELLGGPLDVPHRRQIRTRPYLPPSHRGELRSAVQWPPLTA
jgi:hypothetical protein